MTSEARAVAAQAERVFDALGDATRRKIVAQLGAGPHSVTALATPLGITVTAVAQHLRVLEAAGLLDTEKVGRVRQCQLRQDGFAALERWVFERRPRWNERFDRLGALLDEAQDQA